MKKRKKLTTIKVEYRKKEKRKQKKERDVKDVKGEEEER